jgi:thioredoxin 1
MTDNGAMPRIVTGPLDAEWAVVALCAEWCGTCRDYFTAFSQRAESDRAVRHLWIDIEDDSGWLGDVEVETLPSLLILRDAKPMFFGPVLPRIDVLERTLRALVDHGPAANAVPAEQRATVEHIVAELMRERHVGTPRSPAK